jgi:hypothetical protein
MKISGDLMFVEIWLIFSKTTNIIEDNLQNNRWCGNPGQFEIQGLEVQGVTE